MGRVGARLGVAALLAALCLAVPFGAAAAASVAPGEYTGTHTGKGGGVTVDVSPDGLIVYAMKLQAVPGTTLHGSCSADYTINRNLAVVDGRFGFGDGFIAVQGTFSPTEPGVLSGAFEIHATGVASPYGVECNVNTRLEYSARLKAGAVAPPFSPPAVAPAPATPTPAPTPRPTVAPTPSPVASSTAVPATATPAAATCLSPAFAFGFNALKLALGPLMGDALECEHLDAASGDTLQRTSAGLGIYRVSSNTPIFTDGNTHWALTPDGLVTWTGDSIDPPPPDPAA